MLEEEEIIVWFMSRFGSLPTHSAARVIRQTEEYAVVEQLLTDERGVAHWVVRYRSTLWTCWPLRDRDSDMMTLQEAD